MLRCGMSICCGKWGVLTMRSQNVVPPLFLDFMQIQECALRPLVIAKDEARILPTPLHNTTASAPGVEFVQNRATRHCFDDVRPGKLVEQEVCAHDLLLRCDNGFAAFAPPLTSAAEEVDTMTNIPGEGIAAVQSALLPAMA